MVKRFTLAVPLLVCAAAGVARAESFRVVANPSVTVAAIDARELSRLFLKKSASWPDGQKVLAVDQDRTSPVRGAFSRAVHGRDADAVVSYWQTMVFSGRDTPPPVRSSDGAVLALVRSTPGAVGYVSVGAALDGVKPIAVK